MHIDADLGLITEHEGDGCRLIRPIGFTVTWENGHFIAENATLGHFGEGATVDEAVRDMLHSLCVVFSDYNDTPDEMLDEGVRELLRKHTLFFQKVQSCT